MVISFPIVLLSLILVAGPCQEGQAPYHELLASREAEIFRVFVDEHQGRAQYHVLSRRRALGAFELRSGSAVVANPPRVRLPAGDLGQNQAWILSPGGTALGLLEAIVEHGATTTTYFTYPRGDGSVILSRPDDSDVAVSDAAGTVFFVRAGHTPRFPVRIEVLEPNGEPRLGALERDALGRVRFSASGRSFAVQTGSQIEVFEGANRTRTHEGDRELQLGSDGRWLLVERPGRVEAHDLTDPGNSIRLPTVGPVLFMIAAGNHALVGEAGQATLHDLTGARGSVSVSPEDGFHFSSGALLPRENGRPWVALGQLGVRMPTLFFPESSGPVLGHSEIPEPRALATVTIHDPTTRAPVEVWDDFELSDWLAESPELQWTGEGRLLAVFPELAVIGARTYGP